MVRLWGAGQIKQGLAYFCGLSHLVRHVATEQYHSSNTDTAAKPTDKSASDTHATYYALQTELLLRTLDSQLFESLRAGRKVAVIVVCIENLQALTDKLWHAQKNALYTEVQARLTQSLKHNDHLYHTAPNQFTVTLADLENESEVIAVRKMLKRALEQPFKYPPDHWIAQVRLGYACAPMHTSAAEHLIKLAHQNILATRPALTSVRTLNRQSMAQTNTQQSNAQAVDARSTPAPNRSATMRPKPSQPDPLVDDLRQAIARQQLTLYYQPIVNTNEQSIYKAEALLRWTHPIMGNIPPTTFIPLAETHGLMPQIGDWVLLEAAKQVRKWQQSLDAAFQISINKSPVEFTHSHALAAEQWLQTLMDIGVNNQSIAIEITEGMFMEGNEAITHQLKLLREAGIQISIDDFGIGYSSLAYLKKFAVDTIKIDKYFIDDITHQNADSSICEAMITMAHRLHLKVIAEGVESEAQNILLRQLGCDYIQGYFVSRPLPVNEFEAFHQQFQRIHAHTHQQSDSLHA